MVNYACKDGSGNRTKDAQQIKTQLNKLLMLILGLNLVVGLVVLGIVLYHMEENLASWNGSQDLMPPDVQFNMTYDD